MQSIDTTPRFRNLSINATPRTVTTSSFSFHDEKPSSEKQCFMCRQANVYIKPIGMQQERQVERYHPPPLSRAQIEELSEKKQLTKREARMLLQCYFPEIKNVKYFQLHKYHSCCYDPKHLNLCKNHITALQHERELYPHHHFEHQNDETHSKEYEKFGKNPNRVSFVRIKIEPTKGIPTRFLGPAALPESLADMLIKQVNRYEDKKKLPTFDAQLQSASEIQPRRFEPPYEKNVSRLSEHLANLGSDDDESDGNDDGSSVSEEDAPYAHSPNSNIRGYYGRVTNRPRMKYEKRLQTEERKEKSTISQNRYGDLVVEDLEDLAPLYVHDPTTVDRTSKGLKKKKRRRRTRRRTRIHNKPKLNHWEILALEQSKQEACGCRHHVRRREADEVVYDWCRCKDHSHKDVKARRKSLPTLPPAPPPSPPRKPRKIRKNEATTGELALAYDPTTVDYDVIQEILYFRTSSGRLVKPEITNRFGFNNISSSKSRHQHKPVFTNAFQSVDKHFHKDQSSMTDSPSLSTSHRLKPIVELSPSPTRKNGGMYGDDDEEEEEDDTAQFIPPKYLPESPSLTPTPTVVSSIQKSSKPTYATEGATPNFDRESSLLANRRWFDQPLGDQNLGAVHDGRYGLIAGTTAENYEYESQLPNNSYTDSSKHKNRSNCTIS